MRKSLFAKGEKRNGEEGRRGKGIRRGERI